MVFSRRKTSPADDADKKVIWIRGIEAPDQGRMKRSDRRGFIL